MGIELKTFNPVVFDDPEFCRTYKGVCDHMDVGKKCSLFGNKQLKHAEITYYIKKCQECKDHYLKNKTQ